MCFDRYGQNIPPQVIVSLPNGQEFTGTYLPSSRSISGLNFFQLEDIVMLSYCGDGRFEAVVFASNTMEKMYSPVATRIGKYL